MPRILITFAHPLEAAPTLAQLKVEPLDRDHLYAFEQGKILITGLGPVAAAAQTAAHAIDCDEVWNYGLAGALRSDIPVGEIRPIGAVGKHLSFAPNTPFHSVRLAETSHPDLPLGPGWRLLTSPYPIWDSQLKTQLAESYDVVDMEGYGIASAAAAHGLPCKQWKIISDHALDQGWPELKKNITKLATHLSEVVLQELALH